ncbi:hypothetical protein CHU95_20630 [Niveispirillum lacus]|uniref:Uncharacterized protein n=1 Tax=Niveispirillum lacus TaxID=1981099 RepID=A0A255YSX8_9PROT|nr:hypothetical protein CHU95_20630 [Niveispirillum lacus]
MQVPLPAGRRHAPIHRFELCQVHHVQGADTGQIKETDRPRRIEAHICAGTLIVKFKVPNKWHGRPQVLQVQQFTPTMVANDQIGTISALRQEGTGRQNGLPLANCGFRAGQVGMNAAVPLIMEIIVVQPDTCHVAGGVTGHRIDLHPRKSGKATGQMHKLPWKKLMDKQYFIH